MTSTATQSRFARGGDAAVDADEAIRASRGGGSFRKTHYLPKIGKGNHIYLRYLTDSPSWIYVDSHPSVPTKPAPQDWPSDRRWPESMPAVCRYDKAFKEVLDKDTGKVLFPAVYNDCYVCDAELVNQWGRKCTPVVRVYALAILREEVLGTAEMAAAGQIPAEMVGKRVGLKDASREVEIPTKDDKGEVIKDKENKVVYETITEPAIIVVNQAVGNYFAGLQSMYGMYGSIVDRDFAVQQHDEKKDVEFIHMPLDPIPSLKPGEPAWQRYLDAIVAQGESVDLEHILNDRSGDDFFARFFDPSKTPAKREGTQDTKPSTPGASAPAAQQDAAPSNEPASADMLAQMRERVRGTGAAPAAAAPTQEPEKAPESTPEAPAPTGPVAPIDFSS